VIGWSAAGGDWTGAAAPMIAERIKADLRPGAIVLLHDDREGGEPATPRDGASTVEALSLLLGHLDTAGLLSITIPEMLGLGRPCRVIQFGRAASRQRGEDGLGGETTRASAGPDDLATGGTSSPRKPSAT
jgi:hypothetical protein